MPDSIDERLARLGGDLEAGAGIRPPVTVRSRGDHIRVAHRRRMVAVSAVTAVAVVGVGTLAAFRPGSGHGKTVVTPGSTSPSRSGSPGPSSAAGSSAGAPHTAAGKAIVVIDTHNHRMTAYDKAGNVLGTTPTLPGSSSGVPTGTFTVIAKMPQEHLTGTSQPLGGHFDLTVSWAVEIDANNAQIYGMSWPERSAPITAAPGDMCLETQAAEWLYEHVAVGDQIQIKFL